MKSLLRRLLRAYLAQFPVTEGKGFLYRKLSGVLLPAEREVTVELAPGFSIGLDLCERSQREIFYFGSYERKESALIRRILHPGDVFWDVGANIGYYTLLAAACVGPQGRVVAFEPFPPAWERLQRNIRLNSFGHIRCVNIAVSSAVGTATLFFERNVPDGVANLATWGQHMFTATCDTVTLDRFLLECKERPPTVMKVDVEGAETSVLAGGRGVLSSSMPPMLLVEMEEMQLGTHGTSKAEVQDMLSRLGYIAFQLVGRRWIPCRDVSRARSRNIFWMNPSVETHRARASGRDGEGPRDLTCPGLWR